MEQGFIDEELFKQAFSRPLDLGRIYNAGNYERENIVLVATEDLYLDEYMLMQMEYGEDGLPDYARSHFLTFDSIEVKAGDRVRIRTCKGEDTEEIGVNTGKHYDVVYWNLDAPIWKDRDNNVRIQLMGNSYEICPDPEEDKMQ